jgi:hypothetical protein
MQRNLFSKSFRQRLKRTFQAIDRVRRCDIAVNCDRVALSKEFQRASVKFQNIFVTINEDHGNILDSRTQAVDQGPDSKLQQRPELMYTRSGLSPQPEYCGEQ